MSRRANGQEPIDRTERTTARRLLLLSRRIIRFHASTIQVCLMALGLFGCGGNSSRQDGAQSDGPDSLAGPSATAGFVADELCQECHPGIYETFHQLGMGRSFDQSPIRLSGEDFDSSHFYHAPSNRHYEMALEGRELYQVRYQLDASGKRINELKVRVDAVIGSGNHARSYLHRAPSGEMFQLPLGWYSEGGGKWRMNPGYDRPDHPGFQRKINRECMFCHNAYPLGIAATADDFWQPDVFPESLPEGIGCQRCHGPGQRHVELAKRADSTVEQLQNSIVNPVKLAPDRRDDVCNQCHLQPSALVSSILVQMDRDDYSFRAGQSLNEYRAWVDYHDGQENERFEINHHSYRLAQSECFKESEGELSCLTCHDPHRAIPTGQRVQFYRQRCLQCHSVAQCDTAHRIESVQLPSQPQLADCKSCHMPRRRSQDAIHTVMTDHRIVRRSAPEEQRLADQTEPPPIAPTVPLSRYHWRQSPDSYDSVPRGESDLYTIICGARLGNRGAISKLIDYTATRRHELMPMVELADAFRQRGDVERELDVLQVIIEYYPDHVQANLDLAMALAQVGQDEAALERYQRSLQLGPPLPEAELGIGTLMLQRRDLHAAEKHFRNAIQLRPLYAEAHLNLGILLFYEGRAADARSALLQARAIDPTLDIATEYLARLK